MGRVTHRRMSQPATTAPTTATAMIADEDRGEPARGCRRGAVRRGPPPSATARSSASAPRGPGRRVPCPLPSARLGRRPPGHRHSSRARSRAARPGDATRAIAVVTDLELAGAARACRGSARSCGDEPRGRGIGRSRTARGTVGPAAQHVAALARLLVGVRGRELRQPARPTPRASAPAVARRRAPGGSRPCRSRAPGLPPRSRRRAAAAAA